MHGSGSLTTGVVLAFLLGTGLTTAMPALRPHAADAQEGGQTALGEQFFRLDWSVKDDHNGHAMISGYLYNDYGEAADQVQLRITELDASGRPIGTYVAPIGGTVPGFDRAYFNVKVSGRAPSYRVAVYSFNWVEGRD
jgi:hypothetical protein